MGLRALLRRRHEVSADAPSGEGARRCFEARWRRGAGAASTVRMEPSGTDRAVTGVVTARAVRGQRRTPFGGVVSLQVHRER